MFESSWYDDLRIAAGRVAAAPTSLATAAQRRDALRAVQAAQDILDGVHAGLLAELDAGRDYEDESASSTAAWARQHLRMPPKETRARLKAGNTLAQLPKTREAIQTGSIRLAHVQELTAGMTKAGAALIADAEEVLLPVATACDPLDLRQAVKRLITIAHPDELDESWVRGMDKHDVQLNKCGDGFHLNGFLDIVNGTKVKTWLDASAAPRDADDTRTPAQRRVDAFGGLASAALDHGLPSDRGIRPQLHVLCELDTLITTRSAAAGADNHAEPASPADSGLVVEQAELAGFGPIGADLLGYLACSGDLTSVLTDGVTTGATPQASVLNVGRTERLATAKQRHAVRARQGGTCAAPGCTHTHLEVHHASWWDRDGGPTDLDNLVGLCSRCHHLVHARRLNVAADGAGGFTFTKADGLRIPDHRRGATASLRRRLRALASDRSPQIPSTFVVPTADSPAAATSSDSRVAGSIGARERPRQRPTPTRPPSCPPRAPRHHVPQRAHPVLSPIEGRLDRMLSRHHRTSSG